MLKEIGIFATGLLVGAFVWDCVTEEERLACSSSSSDEHDDDNDGEVITTKTYAEKEGDSTPHCSDINNDKHATEMGANATSSNIETETEAATALKNGNTAETTNTSSTEQTKENSFASGITSILGQALA